MNSKAIVQPGHGVASGRNADPRFPGGTIKMQFPFFEKLGLNLSEFFPGTLNLSIAPNTYKILQPFKTFRQVKWHPTEPAEDFSFFHCTLEVNGAQYSALIYYPHPDTKPEHFQPADILEVLAPKIENLAYGDEVLLTVIAEELRFRN